MDAVPPAAPSGAPPPPQQPAVPPAPPARPPPPPPPAAAYEGGNGDSSGAADGKEDSRGGDTRNGERSKEFDGEPHGPTVGGLDLHLQVQHGVICILGYMAVGVLAYSFGLEGWSVTDSLYFSMVTFTTVGYGDVVPETQLGRLFTIFYAISGIVIIGSIISKIGERVADAQVKAIKNIYKQMEDDTMNLVRGSSRRLSSFKKSLNAAAPRGVFRTIWLPHLPLLIPFLIGAYIEGRDQKWTFIDLLYYTTCTITTVGYGDLAPDSPVSRIIAVLFVPMSACALASILSRYAALAAERRVSDAHRSIVHRGLRMTDLDVMDKDGDGEVSKLEFIEFMLLSMKRVDRGMLERLHAQFETLDVDGSGTLDRSDLAAQIQRGSKEQRQRSLSPQDDVNAREESSYESPSVAV